MEAGDGLADGVVEVVGEVGHVGDGFDVSGGDAAAVGADDAAEERGVLVVLDDPRSPFCCQGPVDGELGGADRGCHRVPPVGAVVALAGRTRHAVLLFGAADRAGAAGGQGFADRRELGGGGLAFGQGEVGAVEVGDAACAVVRSTGSGR